MEECVVRFVTQDIVHYLGFLEGIGFTDSAERDSVDGGSTGIVVHKFTIRLLPAWNDMSQRPDGLLDLV